MSNILKRNRIFTALGGSGGGGGATITVVANYAALPAAAGVTGEFRWVSANTGIYLTGLYYSNGVSWEFNQADDITVVADYNALPAANTVTGQFYWASAAVTHTTLFITFTDYNSGLYYSNGATWELIPIPIQATQAEVDTGTNSLKYVTSLTLTNATVVTSKAPLASPTFTGTPLAPTAAALTNNTQIATTAYADAAVAVVSPASRLFTYYNFS